jgi:hypothetical protein
MTLELQQQVEQRVAVAFVEAGGRLIQDQQLDFLGERLGDLDQLLLADAEIGDQRGRRLVQPHLGEQFPGPAEGDVPIDDAEPGRLVAKEDVFRDRQQWDQREFLVNDDDAEVFAVGNRGELPLGALIENLAFIGSVRIDAAEHLHQRGFAGAVFAADGVDLAGLHHQIDIAQRLHARKALGYPSHFQDGGHHQLFGLDGRMG